MTTAARIPARRSSQVFRRAQLPIRGTAFERAARKVLAPPPLAEVPGDRHVEDDGEQDQRAEDRVTPELADLGHTSEALVQGPDEHRAEEGSDDRAAATQRAHTTDDRRSDRGELET